MSQTGPGAAAEGFQPVKSADRTLDVLEALGAAHRQSGGNARRGLGLGELARTLGIPKSSLHGILRTLVQRGWVEADETGVRFGLGLAALRVGAQYLDGDEALARANPTLDWLAELSGETVQLARLDGPDVVYLAKRGSRHPLQLISTVGGRLPAHATALGKAMLATLPPGALEAALDGPLRRLTPHTIVDRSALLADLERTRQRGFAVDDQEAAEGLRCFAVAVRTGQQRPDAVSFSVPTFRLTPELQQRLLELLQAGRARIEASHLPAAPTGVPAAR